MSEDIQYAYPIAVPMKYGRARILKDPGKLPFRWVTLFDGKSHPHVPQLQVHIKGFWWPVDRENFILPGEPGYSDHETSIVDKDIIGYKGYELFSRQKQNGYRTRILLNGEIVHVTPLCEFISQAQKHARSWVDKTESMNNNSVLISITQKLVVDAIREKLEYLDKFGGVDLPTPEYSFAYRDAIKDVQNYLNEL